MTTLRNPVPIFAVPVPGVIYEKRLAAYAVIRNESGAIAAVSVPKGYWLPGGGTRPGETPEETVAREVREELGYATRIVSMIGEAIQYFHVASRDIHYRMHATFFRAELIGEPTATAEHEMCWLDMSKMVSPFMHACHNWAVCQD